MIDRKDNAIKQIKKEKGNEYEDLFTVKSSLISNFNSIRSEQKYNTFINKLYSRLHREGLLTKKLIKNKPTYDEMKIILINV
mgnify:CR=1 FL=1